MPQPIEFLDDGEPRRPEATRPAPRVSRRRRALAIALALAAFGVAAVVARVATDGDPDPRPRQPDVVVPDETVLAGVMTYGPGAALVGYCPGSAALPVDLDSGGPRVVTVTVPAAGGGATTDLQLRPDDLGCDRPASTCPDPACTGTDRTSGDVVSAVTGRIPRASLAEATTVTRAGGELWYRLLVFALPDGGALRVDVVQHALDHATPATGEPRRLVHTRGSVDTVVTVAGTPRPLPEATLRSVAGDSLLTAP